MLIKTVRGLKSRLISIQYKIDHNVPVALSYMYYIIQ